jgi:hypothetical protein
MLLIIWARARTGRFGAGDTDGDGDAAGEIVPDEGEGDSLTAPFVVVDDLEADDTGTAFVADGAALGIEVSAEGAALSFVHDAPTRLATTASMIAEIRGFDIAAVWRNPDTPAPEVVGPPPGRG